MQHFSSPVLATNESIIIWTGLGFEEVGVIIIVIIIIIVLPYMGMTVNEAWPFEQTLNPVSTVGST